MPLGVCAADSAWQGVSVPEQAGCALGCKIVTELGISEWAARV